MFQSTPAHGGRPIFGGPQRLGRIVSIHARTRRATAVCRRKTPPKRSFNPRPHTAGDRAKASRPTTIWPFQSTPAHGGRRFCDHRPVPGCTGFNPRPHTAGDTAREAWAAVEAMFQSTPAHGGRLDGPATLADVQLFQSTPAHGGRPSLGDPTCQNYGFNPRPHTAGDSSFIDSSREFVVSIHARTRRATANALTSFHKSSKRQNSANLTHSSNLHGGIFLRNSLFTCQRSTYKNREPPCFFMVTCLSRCPFTQSAAPAGHRSA